MLHDPTPLSNLPFDQPWCNPKSGYNWNRPTDSDSEVGAGIPRCQAGDPLVS